MRRAWTAVATTAVLLAVAGCTGSNESSVQSGAGSVSSVATTSSPPGTMPIAELCRSLQRLLRTPSSDPAAMAKVLDELRTLASKAPPELRPDLETEIRSGEELLATRGSINPTDPGSLVRAGEAASRNINSWMATNCPR